MIKKHFYISVLLFYCFSGSAQESWSLQDCIKYALAHNVSMQQADLQKRLSRLSLSQIQASRWPSINFTGSSGYRFGLSENPTTGTLQSTNFFSTGFSVSAAITLFNWFSKQHTIKAAEAEAAAEGTTMEKTANDIVLNISAAYLQALLAKELRTEAALQTTQTVFQGEVVQKKIAVGAASDLDFTQVQLQLLTDSVALQSAKEAEETSMLQLKAVLALDAMVMLTIMPLNEKEMNPGVLAEPPEKLYQAALKNLPEFKQVAYQVRAGEERIRAAKSARLPSFSLYASLGTNYVNIASAQSYTYIPQQATGAKVFVNGLGYDVTAPSYQVNVYDVTPLFRQFRQNFGQNIGLSMSVPLANGKSLTTNWHREQVALSQTKLQQQKLQQDTKFAIYTAYTEMLSAQRKKQLSEQAVKQAAKIFDASQKRYNVSLLSIQELQVAKNSLQKVKTDLLLATYELAFKVKLVIFYQNSMLLKD